MQVEWCSVALGKPLAIAIQALEVGHDIWTVFFNFRKAFDSVPHSPLMFIHLIFMSQFEQLSC